MTENRRIEFDGMVLQITRARYARGKMLARVVDKPENLRGLKSRAEYLMGVKGAGARYVNRERGYVMSRAAVDRLVRRLREGYDATVFGKLLPPKCGWQTAYGLPGSRYCEQPVSPGEPYCAEHMRDRAELYER